MFTATFTPTPEFREERGIEVVFQNIDLKTLRAAKTRFILSLCSFLDQGVTINRWGYVADEDNNTIGSVVIIETEEK